MDKKIQEPNLKKQKKKTGRNSWVTKSMRLAFEVLI